MSVLQGVLFEEIERLERVISNYKEKLSSLPRGSIFVRKMGKSSFVYRKRKENGVVISEYLGNFDDQEVKKQIELSEEYKRVKQNIRSARMELEKLKRAYKVYD